MAADKVNLQKAYSKVNSSLTRLFDESGVRRSFTIPYVEGQAMHEHINAVGQIASQAGGLTNNILTTSHHSDGKGWGSGDGHTVGHSADKLRSTIIPKDDENAKAAIDATQAYLNDIAKLLGDKTPELVKANGQLALVKKTNGEGMNLLDFGVMVIQLLHAPTQAVSRAHNGTKPGGHQPKLRGPVQQTAQEEPAPPQGEEQSDDSATGGSEPPAAAPEAAAAPASPSAATPTQG